MNHRSNLNIFHWKMISLISGTWVLAFTMVWLDKIQYLFISNQIRNKMESIRENEKNEIKARIKDLPASFRSEGMTIFIFEAIGTMFLAYGVNATQYLTPSSHMVPNPYWTFFVSCFLYFGIAAAAPFTGGHVNPAVTIGVTSSGLCEGRKVLTYVFSQLCGAFIGVFLCTRSLTFLVYSFFHHSAQIYETEPSVRDIILDGVG